ncbi:MAG: hypothetical protein ACHQRM_15495 [Bacteroidia bacterium]
MTKQNRFFNCHAHCFTDDHVPVYFLSRFLPLNKLLAIKWFTRLMRSSACKDDLGIMGDLVVAIFHFFDRNITKDLMIRYMNFFVYDDVNSQLMVIQEMQAYYPPVTGLVMLTMDMEYMGAGKPKVLLQGQLEELAIVKKQENMKNVIYPFLHCDPRRIMPVQEREKGIEKHFIGDAFLAKAKEYWENKTYQGVKIYPALGYYPFDERLKPVYDYALNNNLPITTHCTVGAVHFKYDLSKEERYHPFLKQYFPDEKKIDYQYNFTHPLNYLCLLDQNLLKTVWKDAPDYANLKICIGHWGGEDEWHEFISDAWSDIEIHTNDRDPALDLSNWIVDPKDSTRKNYTWFSIICSLLKDHRFKNVYTDISYTLEDATLLPLLKMILESNETIRRRVLFGTDFFLVSKSISEREFGINVRSFLGEELFKQIAYTNALEFLNTGLNPITA